MKFYLAGPEVFLEKEKMDELYLDMKTKLRSIGCTGFTPMDSKVSDPTNSKLIYQANVQLINECQGIIANLQPFRGTEPDSGTVWECAYGFGKGKHVFGFTGTNESYFDRTICTLGADVDSGGYSVENFSDCRLNLMLEHSIILYPTFDDIISFLVR